MPLMVFPDISMWGNHPGMLVNKAYWKELQDEFNDYPTDLLRGGWPYSERWNTDIAIVMFLSWFNDPKTSIDAVLDDVNDALKGYGIESIEGTCLNGRRAAGEA